MKKEKNNIGISVTLLGWLLCLALSASAQNAVGIFDGHGDVGTGVKPGDVSYDPKTQQYTVSGAGYNIWADHDEFHFLWKKIKGDFLVYARGEFIGKGVELHRKFGWMARTSLDGNAPHVNTVVHGDGLTSLQFRRTAGAKTEEIRSKLTFADVIQLERKGNTFTMRVAKFGEPFSSEQVTDLDLGEEVYVGVFVGSHNKDVVEKGIFKDVRFSIPARPSETPNQMTLASNLEILDVSNGSREIIYTAPNSIQAPNWTADGKTLIYNRGGLIYTFDLAKREPQVLNTGEVKNNNNDHVISFNNKLLGLSSSVKELGGSIIYTVPLKGGTPKQITPKGPSYLHGWSPDGKDLVFCGSRDGKYDVYKVPAKGGDEVRLTDTEGLDDGPEYSPDGKYIYFNSNRTGTMQIWRMKPDGKDQGTINTPSWSPDNKKIAFISNTEVTPAN